MENKLQTEIRIVDQYRKHSDKITIPLKFVPSDGYYPLLATLPLYRGQSNPYFTHVHNLRVDYVLHKLNIASSVNVFKYRKRSTMNTINLSSGLYSVLGLPKEFEYMLSSLFNRQYRAQGEIDIFCLAVVKYSHLPDITFSIKRGYSQKIATIDLKMNEVIILVNKEKLRKTLYTKTYYTATIRKKILEQINLANDQTTVTVKDVSNEYLESFLNSPHTVRTNSLVETLKIDTEIKDSVFSNLKEVLV